MRRRSHPLLRAVTVGGLALVALVEVFPYLWMVSTSLKDLAEVTRFPPTFWPSPARWDNYARAWASGPFLRYALNNAVQTAAILVLQLFFGCLAGFAFSKLRFRGRDACFLIVIACLIVPPQVRFVPLYMLFSKVGLLNTYASLVLPYAVSALGTFLIREAFMQISDDIVDAARVDGAGHLRTLCTIMIPLSMPVLVTFGLLATQDVWNDFLWPLIITNTENMRTLPIGISRLRDQEGNIDWGVVMAGVIYVIAPLLAVFFWAQRHIVEGIAAGAVKG